MTPALKIAGWLCGALLLVSACALFASHRATKPVMTEASHERVLAADPQGSFHEADVSRGARLFGQCAACHSIGKAGADLDGPNLYGVVGSRVAERRSLYAYTSALRSIGGVWNPERLDAWLTNPAAVAPGTKMKFGGVASARDRADLIAFLTTQGSSKPSP